MMIRTRTFPAMLTLTLIAAGFGCGGGPLSTPLPDDVESWADDEPLQTAIRGLSDEDKQVVLAFLTRRLMSEGLGQPIGPMPDTLGDALKAQRAFVAERERQQAEAEALAAQERQQAEAQYARLREAVTVGLVDKTFVEADWRNGIPRDQIKLVLVFKSNIDRDIAGIKGTVVAQNMFGDQIKRLTLAYDGGIPANSRILWNGNVDYNQFREEDRTLANTPLDRIKIVWQPETILLSDGSTL